MDSAGSDSCHGGAQLVSDANFGKNGRGRAGDEYGFITSPPIGGCFTFTMVAVSSCPTARYCRYFPVLLVLLWSSQAVRRPLPPGTALLIYCWCCRFCCDRLKLSDGRVLLYCWYFCSAGVAGPAVLLRSSQAVRRPRPPATAVLLRPSQAVRRPGTAVRVSPPKEATAASSTWGDNSFFPPACQEI